MIQLNADRLKAFEESSGPVEFVHPTTNEKFVLIRADFYERLQAVIPHFPDDFPHLGT